MNAFLNAHKFLLSFILATVPLICMDIEKKCLKAIKESVLCMYQANNKKSTERKMQDYAEYIFHSLLHKYSTLSYLSLHMPWYGALSSGLFASYLRLTHQN